MKLKQQFKQLSTLLIAFLALVTATAAAPHDPARAASGYAAAPPSSTTSPNAIIKGTGMSRPGSGTGMIGGPAISQRGHRRGEHFGENYLGIVTASLGMLIFIPQIIKSLGQSSNESGPLLCGQEFCLLGFVRQNEERGNAGMTMGTWWALVGMSGPVRSGSGPSSSDENYGSIKPPAAALIAASVRVAAPSLVRALSM